MTVKLCVCGENLINLDNTMRTKEYRPSLYKLLAYQCPNHLVNPNIELG